MSILSLNDDCLMEILHWLDDFTSFYCFSLTCKRFYHVSLETKSWNINVIRRNIRYYGTKFVVNEYPKDRKYCINFPMIGDIVKIAEIYKVTKPTLANVMNVWKTRGPIAAELFTWIADFRLRQEHNVNGEIENVFKKLIIHLPVLNQDLVILTRCNLCSKKLTIKITCRYKHVQCDILENSKQIPCYSKLSEEHVKGFILRTKSLTDIIQKELGETVPSTAGHFLLWFCFYPESLAESLKNASINSQEELRFKNNIKNAEPTQESVQNAIDSLYQSESLMRRIGESTNVATMSKMVQLLNGSTKKRILHHLSKEILFVLGDFQNLTKLYELSDDTILNLVLRVTFLQNTFSESYESDTTNINFRTKGGGILKAEKIGLPFGKFSSKWNFVLPNGQTVFFEIQEFEGLVDPSEYEDNCDPFLKLQPITELVEDCIFNNLERKYIRFTNRFTERLFSAFLFYEYCDRLYLNL